MNEMKMSPLAIIAVLGIVAIALFLGVSASGFSGVLPGNNLYQNKFDQGYYVFYRLLEELDHRIVFEKRYDLPSAGESAIVYLDTPGEEDFNSGELYGWIRRGNTLVLIGSAADTFSQEEIIEYGEEEELQFSDPDWESLAPVPASAYIQEGFFRSQKRWRSIAANSGGVVIAEISLGEGRVLIVSDRNLFANGNMHNLPNALLLDSLFSDLKGMPVYLRERRSAALYDPSIIRELFSGRLQFISFHALFLFLLFLLLSSKRFSRPDSPYGKKRRKITEHIRAVGLFYQNAKAYNLIEQIDREYFKTVICKNKKPAELTEEEFIENTTGKEGFTHDEILTRFAQRNGLINRIRNDKKGTETGRNPKGRQED